MTNFALIVWMYQRTQAAMTVSLMSFCTYLPYVIVSIFAGSLVDHGSKKKILILTDSIAAIGTISILLSMVGGEVPIWLIYTVNIMVGFMNAFQSPASAIVTGLLVPDGQYEKASGLNSFSSNLITVVAPMLSGMVMAIGGLALVLVLDLSSFFVAMITLAWIAIPEKQSEGRRKGPLEGFLEGISFLRKDLGFGGILGGFLVLLGKRKRNPVTLIYVSAAISFLAGDLLMGLGQGVILWSIAAMAASIPLPFVMAGQNRILYERIPVELQGRVFAVRNAIQYSTIPIGILLGGMLADYVFEPFMKGQGTVAVALRSIVGEGMGSGMAVMFLCTGVLGASSCILTYFNKNVVQLKKEQ